MTTSAPWPPGWPRPKGLRAVARAKADGSTGWYWYCRQTGARLPDPMEAPAIFIQAIAAARQPQPRHNAGTIGAALTAWRRSPDYRDAAPRTITKRDTYTRPLDEIAGKPLAALRRPVILELRDAVAEGSGPAAGNAFAQTTSTFLSFCVDRGLVEYNAAARIRALPGGHFLAWTEAEARIAMETFPPSARRAVVLAYHLGQRRGDLASLTWTAYDAAAQRITLQPEKTRRVRERKELPALRLPVHPDLAAELAMWRAGATSTHILTTATGLPWGREYLSGAVKEAVDKAGLRPGLNLHGFRKLAAARLAEAGATALEIKASLGWESLAHVELYTRAAEQDRLAQAAVVRLSTRLSKTGNSKE